MKSPYSRAYRSLCSCWAGSGFSRIASAFLAALTFLPALLLVAGKRSRVLFWPNRPTFDPTSVDADATRVPTDVVLQAGDTLFVNRAPNYFVYGQVQRPGQRQGRIPEEVEILEDSEEPEIQGHRHGQEPVSRRGSE